jgi:iron complex outermembrane recepter protein
VPSVILDALKYIPGVTESTIPNGLDRLTVRGFQIDGATVDGFYDITQSNLDPVTLDRIEVVKGPTPSSRRAAVPAAPSTTSPKSPSSSTPATVCASNTAPSTPAA